MILLLIMVSTFAMSLSWSGYSRPMTSIVSAAEQKLFHMLYRVGAVLLVLDLGGPCVSVEPYQEVQDRLTIFPPS
jgi:hypothetical protein